MQKKKILLVDDEQSLLRILKLNLEDTGRFEVQTESKGANALSVAMAFKPDLIILDFIMPDMDGGDVLKQLESHTQTKKTPVIFMTAVATKEDTKGQGAEIGGHFVLAKPVSVENLIETIDRKLNESGT